MNLAYCVAIFSANGVPGTDRQSVDVAGDVVNFLRRQFACVLATQDSIVIVHVFFPFVSAVWKLAHRIAVVGSDFGARGTDRQSVDAAFDVVNFCRGKHACVLAAQDSVVVFVHSLFLSLVRICDCLPLDAALPLREQVIGITAAIAIGRAGDGGQWTMHRANGGWTTSCAG